jgi:uncharacterized protein YjiK
MRAWQCTGALLGAALIVLGACAEPPGEKSSDASDASDVTDTLTRNARFDLPAGPTRQWKLPAMLREISGLAMNREGRLFAVEDERALIYQLDYASGSMVSRFSLGGPPIKGDFEGIAIDGEGAFYVITSVGRLFKFAEGGSNEAVRYQSFDLGTRELCELEGLAYVGSRDTLALACKRVYDGKKRFIRVYFWSIEFEQLLDDYVQVDIRDVRPLLGSKRMNVSGIEWLASNDHLVLLAAKENTVIEADASGNLIWAGKLQKKYHRQAEGITFDLDGNLLISDEGGRGAARLAVYARGSKESG